MSLDRRKPFARLQPNDSKPADPASTALTATARLTISRPRRQMPSHHYQYQHQHQHQQHQQPHKRYATMIPGSSRSSATSSAESLYSTAGSVPRRRKLSAAEDVAARVRARWAALEALERTTTGASRAANPPHAAADKENASVPMPMPMQVDTAYEKPLPPRPPPLALHIGSTDDGHTTMMDTREDGSGAATPAPAPASAPAAPLAGSTVRTTPTSLTFVDETTDSASPAALQRRPTTTRAVTPPQVRRRASITDELEEAVSAPLPSRHCMRCADGVVAERRSDSCDAEESTYGRSITMSTSWMRRIAWWRTGSHFPFAYTCCRRWLLRVRTVRGRI
jgi:hypothetical protein